MKSLLSVLYFFLAVNYAASAQTFHALIFADTRDEKIGNSCFHDYERMSIEMSTMAYSNDMRLKTYFNREENFNKGRMIDILQELKAEKNDVIFFYYSGHGARAKDDISRYPQLAVGEMPQDFIALEEIDKLLKGKNARLRILLADCCNDTISALSTHIKEVKESNDAPKKEINSYKSLLRSVAGSILVSSSSSGELSLALPDGGVFTMSLLYSLQQIILKTESVNWTELLTDTRNMASKIVNSITEGRQKQTAQYEIKLSPVENQETTVLYQPTSEEADTALMYALLSCADRKKNDTERISVAEFVVKKFFSSNSARIDIVGRNGNTLIDRMSAEKFVNRLALSARLAHLVVLESQKDSEGKVTFLRLHEIYSY